MTTCMKCGKRRDQAAPLCCDCRESARDDEGRLAGRVLRDAEHYALTDVVWAYRQLTNGPDYRE